MKRWRGLGLACSALLAGCVGAADRVSPAPAPAAAALLSKVEAQPTPDDCDIPFEELRARSKACLDAPPGTGRQCEQVAPAQFTEVLWLTVWPDGAAGGYENCSATLIAPGWALSAAHCFSGLPAGPIRRRSATRSLVPRGKSVQVRAHAAVLLTEAEKENWAVEVLIPAAYAGQASNPPYAHDLALLRLAHPYPTDRTEPAQLARVSVPATTMAGYGATDATDNANWGMTVTWPAPLVTSAALSRFAPARRGTLVSGFCLGDSGGPVFSSRVRGCRSTSLVPERRPRLVQGVISYMHSARAGTGASDRDVVASCQGADGMFIQNLADPPARRWICETTDGEANGCG